MLFLSLICSLALIAIVLTNPVKPRNRVFRNLFGGKSLYENSWKRNALKTNPRPVSHFVVDGSFTQLLDHINGKSGTFKQRYWYNKQFYKSGGPAFIMLGGEGPEDPGWLAGGDDVFTETAQSSGAWLFLLEHRYYGLSHVTNDISTANLNYLSSEQAIEDAAFFIRSMIQKFPQLANAKWVTFGGSYPGALAAWMRIKHPELISYAVGSSGPVQATVDFSGYFEVMMTAIKQTDANCATQVSAAFNQVAQLMQTASGRATLKSTFDLCEALDPKNTMNTQTFWSSLYSPYQYIVQYTSQNPATSIPNAICRFYNDQSTPLLNRMQNVNKFYDQQNGISGCMSIDYRSYIKYMQHTTYGPIAESRLWIWQTCTEFGYFQTTNSTTAGPFWGGQNNLPASYYVQTCADIFNRDFTMNYMNQAVAYTNSNYGGIAMTRDSYIILPSGSFDPWSSISKTTSSISTIVPIVIQGASHCQDMIGPSPSDSAALTAGRSKIKSTLLGWLNTKEK